MFETIDFKKSIDTLKVKWDDNNFVNRYLILIFPIGLIAIAIAFIYREIAILPITGLSLTIGLFIFWIYNIRINDKLTKVHFNGSSTELRKLIETEIKHNNWQICRNNFQFITLHTTGKWIVGSKAVILFDKHTILINTQNLDGFRGYFPFSFGRNKKLTKQLIKIVEQYNNQANLT